MPRLFLAWMLCFVVNAFVRNQRLLIAEQRHLLRWSTASLMMTQDPSSTAPDVDLVWKLPGSGSSNNATIKISLQEKPQPLENSKNASLKRPRDGDDEELPHVMEEGEQEGVPDSVLVYERQMRKAQHSKKSGKELDPDDLDVVYVDDHVVLVNKPSGVLTVPGINCKPSLLDIVHAKYGPPNCVDDPVQMIVHRLDQDTSGLVLFGRSPEVTKKLHAQFREKEVTKEYECLVMGHLNIEGYDLSTQNVQLEIDLSLQRDHQHPPFMRVSTPQSETAAIAAVNDLQQHGWKKLVRKKPKKSQTIITVVEESCTASEKGNLPFSRLRLVPITGRTHQLRVHCSALGHPILGDPTYSLYGEAAPVGGLQSLDTYGVSAVDCKAPENVELARVRHSISRCPLDIQKAWTSLHRPNSQPMCLHASLLELRHPVSGQLMKWTKRPSF